MIDARTTSRRGIMDRLQIRPVDSVPLPNVDAAKLTRVDDPVAKFTEMLTFVGGQAHAVERVAEAGGILESIPAYADAARVASLVPEVTAGTVDASQIEDPHELATLDWVIAPGEFIVAENGAIWVDGATLPHRVMLFIPQYLAIVVSRSQCVDHMHEAYARVGKPKPGFGVFVSGPSKTADIEQSLVLGAHGCRTLQVFLTP